MNPAPSTALHCRAAYDTNRFGRASLRAKEKV
jgi:hypothetical protein